MLSPIPSYAYLSLLGKYRHRIDKSYDPDNAYLRFLGNDGPWCIYNGDMRDGVGFAGLQTATLIKFELVKSSEESCGTLVTPNRNGNSTEMVGQLRPSLGSLL